VIWRFARDNDFALLTQDSDFERKAALRGAPPKVILVRTGNIRTPLLRPIIAAQLDRIERFLASATEAMMYVPRPRSLWSPDDPAL
jgi:predicted nuclease of predicted toxin-antitoxin system